MLLEFSVDNFLSIKDSVTFSMNTDDGDENNSISVAINDRKHYQLLKSSVLYGANGSGKSNLLKAMARMRAIVLNEEKVMLSTDRLVHLPFLLNTETQDASTTFEIVFFSNNQKIRYGFDFDSENVYSEWLFVDSNGKEARIFTRDEEDSYVNPSFEEGFVYFDTEKKLIKVPKNQLFLWKCDQNSSELASRVLEWFSDFNLIDGMAHHQFIDYTLNKMKDKEFLKVMSKLICEADIGINSVALQEKEVSFDELPDEVKKLISTQVPNMKDLATSIQQHSILTKHSLYDEKNRLLRGKEVEFNLDKNESKGTVKFFRMLGPILDTLNNGKVLIIDELDSSLHPLLSIKLISLFKDPKINTKGAQVIFATHDTNLLNPVVFSRQEIWFSEKDKYGATKVYSLSELKGVRKNESFAKQYLMGKYGAIPYLGSFEF